MANRQFEWNPRAITFTTVALLIAVLWPIKPNIIPFLPWSVWNWFICCGVVLLSAARFFMRHPVPLPELWLLLFPFAFELFFQKICPTTQVPSVDQLLWAFDANFGYPQRPLGEFLVSSVLVIFFFKMIWWSLPLLFVMAYLVLPDAVQRKFLGAVAATGCLLLPLYALCPAAGPVYLFRDQYKDLASAPSVLLNPHPVFLPAGLELNTTPSGHFAWALLLLWFSYRYARPRVAGFFALIAVLMVVAMLGLGEHYVIDLILSVPYAVAIWSLVERQWARAGGLLAFVAAWLIVLRDGLALAVPHLLVWLVCAFTVSVPFVWGGFKAQRPAEQAPDLAPIS